MTAGQDADSEFTEPTKTEVQPGRSPLPRTASLFQGALT